MADFFGEYLLALGNMGPFYRRPLNGAPLRYGQQTIGINKLKSFMKTICAKAGLVGNFTNHSGKRTCATQLYNAGVAEQEIMKRTGHRSEKSVRKYKRSSDEISENVSNVLNPPSNKKIVKSENRDVALGMEIENQNATDCKCDKQLGFSLQKETFCFSVTAKLAAIGSCFKA